jgi:hypothetical protein
MQTESGATTTKVKAAMMELTGIDPAASYLRRNNKTESTHTDVAQSNSAAN